jgi:hypothetical protein
VRNRGPHPSPVPMSPCQIGPAVNHRPYERALLSMDHVHATTDRLVIRRDGMVMLKSPTRVLDHLTSSEVSVVDPQSGPLVSHAAW